MSTTAAAADKIRLPSDARRAPWQPWFAAATIAMIGVLIYSNSFDAPFVYDGVKFIVHNDAVDSLACWNYKLGGNRPIGFLSFALNYALGGFDVWGYHAVNVAIHVGAAWVLYAVVRATLAGRRLAERYGNASHSLAFAVALLWLVHPLQTQSVTYLYQRLESLMSLFYLLTLYTFVRAQNSPRPEAWYSLSVACCILGMGTKEVMVTAPLAVLWYDRVFVADSRRELVDRRMSFYCYLFSSWIILAFFMLTWKTAYVSGGVLFVDGVSPLQYALSQPGVILHYLALAFWPAALCLDYAWPVAQTAGEIVPPLMTMVVLLALTAWAMVLRPAIGFAAGSFFLILAPTSSVAPIKDLAFEHRMYLPLAALVVVTVIAAHGIWQWATSSGSRPRSVLVRAVPTVAVVAVVTALGCRTLARNEDYQTTLSIWQDVARKRPTNRMAYYNIGTDWLENGRPDEAVPELDKAIALKPVPGQTRLDLAARVNRGRALLQLGRYEDAIKDFDEAVEIESAVPLAYRCRGICYQQLKQYELAILDYSRAIELAPGDAETFYDRGRAYQLKGDRQWALEDYTRAIELQPDYVQAYASRGAVYLELERYAEALADEEKAIELNPVFAEAYVNRARYYFAEKQYGRAWDDVRRSRELGGEPRADFIRDLAKASGRLE